MSEAPYDLNTYAGIQAVLNRTDLAHYLYFTITRNSCGPATMPTEYRQLADYIRGNNTLEDADDASKANPARTLSRLLSLSVMNIPAHMQDVDLTAPCPPAIQAKIAAHYCREYELAVAPKRYHKTDFTQAENVSAFLRDELIQKQIAHRARLDQPDALQPFLGMIMGREKLVTIFNRALGHALFDSVDVISAEGYARFIREKLGLLGVSAEQGASVDFTADTMPQAVRQTIARTIAGDFGITCHPPALVVALRTELAKARV